jgi:exodeoxyribonuclease-3
LKQYDAEGRILRADFGDFSVLSCYFPSGTTGDERQSFKMKFLADFQKYIDDLKKKRPNLLVSGDVNICHTEIDIHNPISNKDTSGFKPEERAWVTQFLASGFVDSFRHLNKEPKNYTWWSYRAGARKRNLGWRIDYHLISTPLTTKLKRSVILPEAVHSDHCPSLVELDVIL